MSTEAIRQAIVDTMTAVPDIGTVHRYQRYAVKQGDFKVLYVTGDILKGWFISRTTVREERIDSETVQQVATWRIEGFHQIDDETESEIIFDGYIDQIRAAFRTDPSLGGVIDTTEVNERFGIQVIDVGPAMFAGVLCHRCRLELRTLCNDDIAELVLDDFVTAHTDYNLDADPVPDMSDTLTLEQD